MTRPAGPLRVLASPATQEADGNPYITALYRSMRGQGVEVEEFTRRGLTQRPDVVHVHWPENLVRWWGHPATVAADVAKVLGGLWVARRRGARLVWTGHDLGPHDMPRPRLYRAYIGAFSRMTDVLISLGKPATDALLGHYPALRGTQTVVIPHGHYRDDYPTPPTRADARAALSLPTNGAVLLTLGLVRRYKNLPAMIRAFNEKARAGSHLVVAGLVIGDDSLASEMQAAAVDAEHVTLRLEVVPADEVSQLHAAADVVVLAYSQGTALHSGAALLALSLNRPVVVPDTPTMRELRDLVGADWVHLFDGDPATAVERAFAVLSESRSDAPDLSVLDWDKLGTQTADAMRG